MNAGPADDKPTDWARTRRARQEEKRRNTEVKKAQASRSTPNGAALGGKLAQLNCLTPADWAERDIPPERKLLGPFSTTSRSQLSADTGLGKTMFALAVGYAIRLQRNFLHWHALVRDKPPRVLIMDGEMPAELVKARLAAATSWFRLETPIADGLYVLSRADFEELPPLDTEAGATWLLSFIDRLGGIDFVILDNIAALTAGCLKEEDSAQAIKMLQLALTSRRIGQLWLHHTGHDQSRGYGAKMREWWLDTVMVAEKLDQPGADVAFRLRFSKCRRRTPENRADFEEVGIALRDGQWTSVTRAKPRANGEAPKCVRISLEALHQALSELGQAPPQIGSPLRGAKRVVRFETWREIFNRMAPYTADQGEARRKAFQRGSGHLIAASTVTKSGDWVWLA